MGNIESLIALMFIVTTTNSIIGIGLYIAGAFEPRGEKADKAVSNLYCRLSELRMNLEEVRGDLITIESILRDNNEVLDTIQTLERQRSENILDLF